MWEQKIYNNALTRLFAFGQNICMLNSAMLTSISILRVVRRFHLPNGSKGIGLMSREIQCSGSKFPQESNTYPTLQEYLKTIFTYAGSYSLEQELHPVEHSGEMQIGDVFIEGGFPGHAMIVVDMAQHTVTHKRVFLLAQSYMPAQNIHIVHNPKKGESADPWYDLDFGEELHTPEWTFRKTQLKRFCDAPRAQHGGFPANNYILLFLDCTGKNKTEGQVALFYSGSNFLRTSSRVALAILTCLTRPVCPPITSTWFLPTPTSFDTSAQSFLLAWLSTGGAVTLIFKASPCCSSTSSREARG